MTISDLVQWLISHRAKVARATYVLQVLVGVFLALLGYGTGRMHFDLIREGARAAGRIVDYKQQNFYSGPGYHSGVTNAFMPVVEFRARDRVIRFKDWLGSSSATGLNDTVRVLYAPGDPSVAMIDRPVWNWLPWAPLFALGCFLTLVGIKNVVWPPG